MRTAIITAAVGCLHGVIAAPLLDLGLGLGSKTSLKQFALDKVLVDGHEIWGDVSDVGVAEQGSHKSRANWMARFPDRTSLAALNIPGTHDTSTWNYSVATQEALFPVTRATGMTMRAPIVHRCQRSSIAASLDAGVRFFDLRYALDPTYSFLTFWHNEALQSERSAVEDVLYSFWNWLDEHPSETVLLSFQYQGGTQEDAGNNAAVQRQLFDILTSPASKQYILQDKNVLPTLGRARGKAVLVRRFDMDQLGAEYDAALPGLHFSPARWTDNGADIELVYNDRTGATAYVEDFYEMTDVPLTAGAEENIASKLNATVAHLHRASSASAPATEKKSLFITFASGRQLDAVNPVYPQYLALGNGTEYTPAGGMNTQLVPILKSLKNKRKGIVVLDFFEEPENLVDLILDL